MRGSGNSPAGEWSGRVPGLVPGLYTVLLLVGGGVQPLPHCSDDISHGLTQDVISLSYLYAKVEKFVVYFTISFVLSL